MSQQELLYQLSQMVCAAYAAYTTTATKNANVIAGHPATQHPAVIPAEAAVLRAQPNLKNVCPIYVYEADPDLDPSAPAPTLLSENLVARKKRVVPNNVVPGSDCGGETGTHEGGYQLFGFTATVPAVGELKAKNVLALRGTVTAYEAGVSLIGWDIDPSTAPSRRRAGIRPHRERRKLHTGNSTLGVVGLMRRLCLRVSRRRL